MRAARSYLWVQLKWLNMMKGGVGMSIRTVMFIALGLMIILIVFAAVSSVISGEGSMVAEFIGGLELPG